MQNEIKKEIKKISRRILYKEEYARKRKERYASRFTKRTDIKSTIKRNKKNYMHKSFDPKHCLRNANIISKSIWYKVLNGEYVPQPAILKYIPKSDGTKREIMIFSIPDSALANVLFRRVFNRNSKNFSPYSYAYRPDKSILDAVISLKSFDWARRVYSIQIDFEKYFDSIPSSYIINLINNESISSITKHERHIFEKFIHHKYATENNYNKGEYKIRHRGTPQGLSASLYLANIANHELDIQLSLQPGSFARFADDVIVLCHTYSDAERIYNCFINHSIQKGIPINQSKSKGIFIVDETKKEIETINCIDYLGYSFCKGGVTIPKKSINRIRSRISRLINIYLINYISKFGFNSRRSSASSPQFDWDLLGLICELRLSIYGGLSEKDISDFINNNKQLPVVKGMMSFYCLIDDPKPFKELDGWLLSVVRRAMKLRSDILQTKYSASCPSPSNDQLATGKWLDMNAWKGEDKPDARMPSFIRGWRAARKHYLTLGLKNVRPITYYDNIDVIFDYT